MTAASGSLCDEIVAREPLAAARAELDWCTPRAAAALGAGLSGRAGG